MESFLRARADEVVPGGKLLVQVFGADEQVRVSDGIYDALNAAVLEVLEAGLIDQAAYEAYYQPIYVRTLDELTEPVTPDGGLATLFRLDRSATYEVEVPFVEAFRRTGNAAAFGRSYTGFLRAFTESELRVAFPDDPDRIAHEVYGRAERLISTEPDRFPFRYVAIAALMTRRETSDAPAGGRDRALENSIRSSAAIVLGTALAWWCASAALAHLCTGQATTNISAKVSSPKPVSTGGSRSYGSLSTENERSEL